MRVAMIGAGYVGLVSGACIADFGHQVVCVDKDSSRIAALNAGEIPIFEPGLTEIVRALREGRDPPEVRTLQGWRRELVGDELLALLGAHAQLAGGPGLDEVVRGVRADARHDGIAVE